MIALTLKQVRAFKPCREDWIRIKGILSGADGPITAAAAVDAGATLDDIVWIASKVAVSDTDVERRLRLWVADCAAHVLGVFEAEKPDDMRPREAVIAARRYARGEIGDASLVAARDARDTRTIKKQWQLARLVEWLSDEEPKDWLLPVREEPK